MSVAVHEDSNGKPGDKLFDLVSPDEFGAGHSFFEAPPGTHLAPDTSYVLVWSHLRGTTHRLQKTASNSEDSGKATGSSIENAYYRGADLGSLSEDSGGNSVEIAVYTEVNTETVVFIEEVTRSPRSPPSSRASRRRRHPQVLRPAGRTMPHVRRLRPGAHRLPVNDHDGGKCPTCRFGNNRARKRIPKPRNRGAWRNGVHVP